MVWDVNRYAFIEPAIRPTPTRSTRACGGRPSSTTSTDCSRWRQAAGRPTATTSRTSPSSPATTGWIVIDPLTAEACARECLLLANQHLGERPVVAVIYTHSHADHFGGVLGVTSQADVDAGSCRVIAPQGFLQAAVSRERDRRLRHGAPRHVPVRTVAAPGPRGHVDCGLGKALPLALPGVDRANRGGHHHRSRSSSSMVFGVVFQLTPETEAPAEMNFFFPLHVLEFIGRIFCQASGNRRVRHATCPGPQ